MDDEPGVERRLAAILAADVVGYSRLMEADEAGTHARLKALRKEFVEPRIAAHHGRIVKLTGDGVLVEFPSVVEAVLCAVDVQRIVAERNAELPPDQRLEFRIGVNLGDVIIEDDDIYGDGVNVAARLQTLAEPGGICVSRTVYNHVKNKVGLAFEPMGEHKVKNIAEPITVYRVVPGPGGAAKTRPLGLAWALHGRRPAAVGAAVVLVLGAGAVAGWHAFWWPSSDLQVTDAAEAEETPALPLPDKPSIAVLPFENLSGDPERERLADGITEDIITDLSRFRELFVIARNSTAVYKGQPTDVRQIARELGVHYVLEGSLQTDGDRVRVTAQLIDAASGTHLWSERYDRALDDVFAVQDEVTQQVVGTLGGYWGRLARAGREVARRKPPEDLQAYDYYLLGIDHKHQFTEEDNKKAQELLNRAIALDPEFARAYVGLAWTHQIDLWLGLSEDPAKSLAEFEAAARRAVRLDDADAEAHVALGTALFYYDQIEGGAREFDRALELGTNNADVLVILAWNRPTKVGGAQEDVELVKRAMRLNPHYPEWYLSSLGFAALHAQAYQEAITALRRVTSPTIADLAHLALSYAQLGRDAEAEALMAELLRVDPEFSAERHAYNDAFVDQGVIAHFLESARKAGLPLCATEAQLVKYPDMKRLPQCDAERARS